MSDSDRFSRTLTAADANNIVLLVDFNQILVPYELLKADNIVSHTIAIEDLHAKIGLFSLLEASWPNTNEVLSTEAQQNAAQAKILKEGQKVYLELYTAKGNGPWELQGEEILQNKNGLEQPWSLMLLMGTNLTALVGESIKIGVKIASKAQGVGGLKGNDYVRILGTWRKNTKIESKKKDDGIEALNARINALEALISVFGAPSETLPGNNGLVPAPPAGGQEFYLKGDRSWEDFSNKFPALTGNNTFTGVNTIKGDFVLQTDTDAYNTFRYIGSNSSYCDAGIAPSSFSRDYYISFQAAGGGVNGFRIKSENYDLLSSGNLAVMKGITAGASIIPASPPANAWGVDFTQGGSSIILPAGASYDLATGSGQVVVYDNANGNFIFTFCTAGSVRAVDSTTNGSIVAGSPPSGKVGLFYNAGTAKYRLFNNGSDTRTLIISSLKMRGAS